MEQQEKPGRGIVISLRAQQQNGKPTDEGKHALLANADPGTQTSQGVLFSMRTAIQNYMYEI